MHKQKGDEVMATELRNIEIASVDRRFQSRRSVSKERGAEVVESVKKHGVINPARIDAKGRLLIGDVAVWAAGTAGHTIIPALIDDKEYTEGEAICFQLAADGQAVPYKISERAAMIEKALTLTQLSAAQLASEIGASPASVSRQRAIGQLEQLFRDLVDSGLGEGKGYQLALMSPEERMALLPQLQRGELSREDLIAARKPARPTPREEDSASPTKIKVVLDDGRAVTVQAPELDMSSYVDAIQLLLRKARHAQKQGFALQEFVRSIRKVKSTSTKGESNGPV
jgi:ParB/RepB/Spo0J family partition protein